MTKVVDLSRMFPRQVLLLSTVHLEGKAVLYKFAQAYLKATEAGERKLIWVSTEQPADKIPAMFKDYGYPIDEHKSRLLFVDFVSSGAGVELPKTDLNVSYIESPNNIVETSMALSDLFGDPSVGLAVIDSVNGLLVFNRREHVMQLLRFLSPIARQTNTTVLLAFERGEHPKELETAVRLCADASMSVEDKTLILKARKGSASIEMG